jgi:hypothetical protein
VDLVLIGRSYLLSGEPRSAGKYRSGAAAAHNDEPVYGRALVVLPTGTGAGCSANDRSMGHTFRRV